MKKILSIIAVTTLFLTGCSANNYPETYRSVDELRDAFIQAGGDCPEWEQTNQVKFATESGTCSSSNVLSIYSSKAAVDEAVTAFKSISLGGSTLLIGENWIINDKKVKDLDDAIGGTFLSTS